MRDNVAKTMPDKTRGALSNPEGRFEIHARENYHDGWDIEEDPLPALETVLYPENARTVISRNDSPDIGFEQSINPYRGCEHGCVYCYARPSHAYMNLSPGLDFETKIFHKVDAAAILTDELAKAKYECKPIMLGANTDPYQPAEAKLKITRSILETLNKYNHPVVIITKSSLIERDLDLIAAMAQKRLAKVAVSVTTLRADLKRTLEPRASSPQARLRVIRNFSDAGVPVRVMTAPLIPMINDMELERILGMAATAGARHASYVLIRLPYEVKDLFREWLAQHYPERAEHVMSLIKQMRGGKDYDATFGKRMRGEGEYATLLNQRFEIACRRYNLNMFPSETLDTHSFLRPAKAQPDSDQIDLWA
jgi:DNA repair photolyase